MTLRRALVLLGVVGLSVGVTGCGSTVRVGVGESGVAAPAGQSGEFDDGLAMSTADGTVAGEDTSGADGGSTGDGLEFTTGTAAGPGGRGAPATDGTGQPSAPGASTGGQSGSDNRGSTAAGRGVTDEAILIGRLRQENVAAANRAFGNTVPEADADRYDRIMVDHINANGGVAGRQLKIVYHTVDASEGQSTQQIEQSACARWTEDQPVFAVLWGGTSSTDGLRECLGDRAVPMVYENVFSDSDRHTFERFPSYFSINALDLTTTGRALVDGLAAGDYFQPSSDAALDQSPRVGLLTFDEPIRRRAVEEALKPALADHGLTSTDEFYFTNPDSEANSGRALSEIPGAVLRFKQNRIDRVVIFGDTRGSIAAYFSRAAESQDYYPRYGVTSASAVQALIDTGNANPQSFEDAVNVGWNPWGDHGMRPKTISPGPGYRRCLELMEANDVDFTNVNALVVALRTCDGFFFMEAVLDNAASSLTPAGFVRSAETLNDFPTAVGYAASFGSQHHEGVAAVRTSVFRREACGCFTYADDGPRRIR